jgi:hypothetical protein
MIPQSPCRALWAPRPAGPRGDPPSRRHGLCVLSGVVAQELGECAAGGRAPFPRLRVRLAATRRSDLLLDRPADPESGRGTVGSARRQFGTPSRHDWAVTMKLCEMTVRLGVAPSVLRDRLKAVGWDYRSVAAEVSPDAVSAVLDRWPPRVADADGTATCPCCRLPQRLEPDQFGVIETYCRSCQRHLGEDPASRLQRAASHEEMLRERLEAARKAEVAAYGECDVQRDRARMAYEARERAVEQLREVSELHVIRPDGRCSCDQPGVQDCRHPYRPWTQRMIRRVEEAEQCSAGSSSDDEPGPSEARVRA